MKKLHYIVLSLLVSIFAFTSCDALLNSDSERYTFEDDFQMKSAHDTIYSMVGVFSQLQKLGDRYVLLGELRGELMETKENASRFLKEINEFNYSEENPFLNQKDYYAVINSCNYITHYVDTSYTVLGDKAIMRSYAAAKSIRAWTYLQLALNFDTVTYYTNPLFTVSAATRPYPALGLKELADSLIADLEPIKGINKLNLGSFGAFRTQMMVFPINFVLGDLYLWKGDYEKAATAYHDLMMSSNCTISNYISSWTRVENGVFLSYSPNWNRIFEPNSNENLATLGSSSSYGQQFTVDSLSFHYDIAPTNISINKWEKSLYYFSFALQKEGDLRAYGSYYHVNNKLSSQINTYDVSVNPYIVKYQKMNTATEKCLVVYRNSLLYLRYAEAVNRLNCPLLAFAAIKKGLKYSTTSSVQAVAKEILNYGNGRTPSFMSFPNNSFFTNNVGIHARGLGNSDLDSLVFTIPKKGSRADTIDYVEDLIIEELALEMAFEGNRFHDLMRVALRRNNPAYLADKVAAKYSINKDAIKEKLLRPVNWYLPH